MKDDERARIERIRDLSRDGSMIPGEENDEAAMILVEIWRIARELLGEELSHAD